MRNKRIPLEGWKQTQHSCKLHPQGDGERKGCDSGAGACAKVRGGREGTGRRGRPGTLIQQPGWERLLASYPAGQPPGTGFREDGRAESTARPKRPESGPRPETLVTGSTIQGCRQLPDRHSKAAVGKPRPGKSGAAGSPDRQGLVVPVPRVPSGAPQGRSLQARVRELGVSSQGPGAPRGGAGPGCEGGRSAEEGTRMWGRRAALTRAGQPR